MTDPIDRRRMIALAGAAGVAVPLAQAQAQSPTAERKSMMDKQIVEISKDNPVLGSTLGSYEKFGYSPAVRAGGLLFIAGQIGRRPDGKIGETVAEQTDIALQRTAEILRLQGLTMADLVEVVSYHVDLQANLEEFMAVKARYSQRPFPAWSIIGIDALASPGLKIEIRSIAALRG